MPTRNINSDLKVNADLTLPSLSTYSGSDVTALMIAGADVVGKRALGTNAFNSTSFLPLTGGTMSGHILLNNGIELRSKDTSSNVKTIARINSSNQLEYGWSGGGPVKFMGGGSYTERMRIHSDGNIGIGTTSPEDKLDIAGKLRISDNKTANTNKTNRIRGEHYDIAQEPTTFMFMNNFSTVNALHIGGGSTVENAATSLNFYTAANNTTTQGSNRMVIDSSGNVGIGTTAPSVGLQLGNSVSGQTKTAIFNSEGGSEVGLTIQSRTNRAKLRVADNDSNAYVVAEAGKAFFGTSSNGDANNITVLTGGNVGIGTTSPSAKLHVAGQIMISPSSGTPSLKFQDSGSTNAYIDLTDGQQRFDFRDDSDTVMSITLDTLHVGIGTTSPESGLHLQGASNTSSGFTIENTSGGTSKKFGFQPQYNDDRLDIWYNSNATAAITIKDGGNVGIGTVSPAEKLEVAGNVKLTGNLNVGGYIHPNDENGNLRIFGGNDTTNDAQILLHGNSDSWGSLEFNYGYDSTNSFLKISQGSNEHLRITNGGKVGIGTTSPDSKLSVTSTSNSSEDLVYLKSGADQIDEYLGIAFETLVGGNGPHAAIRVYNGPSASDSYMSLLTTTNGVTLTQGLTQNYLGNVGIGTTSPATSLEVNGSIAATGVLNAYTTSGSTQIGFDGTSSFITANAGGGSNANLKFYSGSNAERMVILSNGNVGIGTANPAEKLELFSASDVALRIHKSSVGEFRMGVAGSAGSDTAQFITNTNGFDFRGDSNTFPDGGSSRLFISSTGNVDIGSVFAFDTSTDRLTITNNQNTGGINLSGGNSRIYFGGYRAIEGDQSGGTLYIGEGYGTISLMDDVAVSGDATVSGALNINVGSSIHGTITSSSNSLTLNARNTGIMLFQSGGSEKMRITSSGNVGIGTTGPNSPLSVQSNSGGGAARFIGRSSDSISGLEFFNNAESSSVYLQGNGSWFRSRADGGFHFAKGVTPTTSDTNGFTINGLNVGIGTANPTSILDIRDTQTGGASEIKLFNLDQGNTTTQTSALVMSPDVRANGVKIAAVKENADFSSSANKDVAITFSPVLNNASAEKMRITSDGNVGIGTTSPSAALDVVGSSKFRGTVNHSWFNYSTGEDTYIRGGKTTSKVHINDSHSADVLIAVGGGNVGIGTTSPSKKLDVDGEAIIDSTLSLRSDGGSNYTASRIELNSHNDFRGAGLYLYGINRTWYAGSPYQDFDGKFVIGKTNTYGDRSAAQASNALFTILSGGNVGIGTTNPNTTLHLATSASSTLTIQNTTNSGNASLKFRDEGDNDQYSVYYAMGANRAYNSVNGNGLTIYSSQVSAEIARFGNSSNGYQDSYFVGNVGIGTTSPDSKLQVKSSGSNIDEITLVHSGNTVKIAALGQESSHGSLYLRHNNGVNKVRLSAGGNSSYILDSNVGIGTVSPNYQLDVRDGIVFAGRAVSDDGGISYTNTAAVFSSRGVDHDASRTNVLRLMRDGTSGVQYAGLADFDLESWESSGVYSRTAMTLKLGHGNLPSDTADVMTWRSNGNVGIGTTSPKGKLHVLDGTAGSYTPDSEADTVVIESSVVGGISLIGTGGGSAQKQKLVFGTTGDTTGAVVMHDPNNSVMSVGTTTASNYLKFLTGNSTEAMRLAADGNVGIGTTNPDSKLHVASGNVLISNNQFYTAESTLGTNYKLAGLTSGNVIQIGAIDYTSASTVFAGGDNLRLTTGGASGTTRLYINSSGNVGIGTTNPSQKLHVEGNIELQAGWEIGSNNGSYWQRIRTEDSSVSTTNAFNFETRNGSGSFIKHMVIRNDGNVGVGNATPATKLAVEGTIAHKVYTVSTLPSASPAGQRAFVSDSSYSLSQAHGLVTVGSGSNFCPMYSDGTNWRVG